MHRVIANVVGNAVAAVFSASVTVVRLTNIFLSFFRGVLHDVHVYFPNILNRAIATSAAIMMMMMTVSWQTNEVADVTIVLMRHCIHCSAILLFIICPSSVKPFFISSHTKNSHTHNIPSTIASHFPLGHSNTASIPLKVKMFLEFSE